MNNEILCEYARILLGGLATKEYGFCCLPYGHPLPHVYEEHSGEELCSQCYQSFGKADRLHCQNHDRVARHRFRSPGVAPTVIDLNKIKEKDMASVNKVVKTPKEPVIPARFEYMTYDEARALIAADYGVPYYEVTISNRSIMAGALRIVATFESLVDFPANCGMKILTGCSSLAISHNIRLYTAIHSIYLLSGTYGGGACCVATTASDQVDAREFFRYTGWLEIPLGNNPNSSRDITMWVLRFDQARKSLATTLEKGI